MLLNIYLKNRIKKRYPNMFPQRIKDIFFISINNCIALDFSAIQTFSCNR